MATVRVLPPRGSPPSWNHFARRTWLEIRLGMRYVAGDLPTTVFPALGFTLVAARYAGLPWPQLVAAAVESVELCV